MNRGTIKYRIAVAAVSVAAAFCGCDDASSEVIPLEDMRAETVAEDSGKMPDAGRTEDTGKMTDAAKSPDEGREEENKPRIVKVYVCGAVRAPDVYSLDENMRVVDAVDAAGGFTEDAGTDYLNLASPVTDGEKIYIPTRVEIEEALAAGEELYGTVVNITTNTPGAGTTDSGINAAKSDTTDSDAGGLVDINSADKTTLMTLPGIGESKADKIIAYRQENGGFSAIEDLMLVGGIKEGLFNKVKDRICVK